MTDDPKVPPVPAPGPVPVPAPAPAPEPKLPAPVVDSKMPLGTRAQAEYYARHPETFADVLGEMEKAGHIETNARIERLELEIATRDAVAEHGLAKEDIQFITGNTREKLNASAAAYKARLDSLKGDELPESKVEDTQLPVVKAGEAIKPTPAPPPISEIVTAHEGIPSVDAAKAELAKSLEGVTYSG